MAGSWALNSLYTHFWEPIPGPLTTWPLVSKSAPVGLVLGSSNLLEAIDARLLEREMGAQLSWKNASQRGLAGEALLATAGEWVAASDSGQIRFLLLELIGRPSNMPLSSWRSARQVPWFEFVRAEWEIGEERVARIKNALEWGMMRTTFGLHALLHPPTDPPSDLRGGSKSSRRFHLKSDRDSLHIASLEQREQAITAGAFVQFETVVFPVRMLTKLKRDCDAKGIQLWLLVPPTTDSGAAIPDVAKQLGGSLIFLTGGSVPSPFARASMLSDGRHVNAEGAAAVTTQLAQDLLKSAY